MVADYFRTMPLFTARLLLGSWLLAVVVFLGMPFYAPPVNEWAAYHGNYGNLGPSCTLSIYTPGVECHNGDNLTALALAANRTTVCDCMQGVFSETICPIKQPFTVSGYIASAPANGLVWAVSIVPLMSMLWHAEYVEVMYNPSSTFLREVMFWTLVLGIASYNMLSVKANCSFHGDHMFWIGLVLIPSITIHWLIVAYFIAAGGGKTKHWVLVIVLLLCLVGLSGAREFVDRNFTCKECRWCCTYGYWFFESQVLVLVLGMPTAMVWIGGVPLPMPKEMKESLLNAREDH